MRSRTLVEYYDRIDTTLLEVLSDIRDLMTAQGEEKGK